MSQRISVAVIAGSKSDQPVTDEAAKILTELEIPNEVKFLSAHRNPEGLRDYVAKSEAKVFIAVAGLAAHLPGVVASMGLRPVIGVPVSVKLNGLDSLLSIVQMPPGVPVACVGVDNARNAGILAAEYLALSDPANLRPAWEDERVMAMKPRGTFVRSGKVKDIYEVDENHLLFDFTDRVSAFDVILPSTIPRKGEVLCKLSAYWFETLGVPNHMVRTEGSNAMLVRKMSMIPVECVVRGYLYGSLFERFSKGEVSLPVEKVLATKLPQPYFDPTTKSEVKDEPITEAEIVREGRMSSAEVQEVKASTVSIYNKMNLRAAEAGFILADLKLEFGRREGSVVLGDSIGPDEFRMWPADKYAPGRTQDSYDKQPVRDWLISVGYRDKLEKARKGGEPLPPPPLLPQDLIDLVSNRYVHIYETFTGKKL